jgi:hypothetical protein
MMKSNLKKSNLDKIYILDLALTLEKEWKKLSISDTVLFYHKLCYTFAKKFDEVYVIDCGNSLNPYGISLLAKFDSRDPFVILNKIKISRVFTVFQLDSAVSKVISKNPKIFLITELDKILSDESISNQEKVATIKSAFKKIKKTKASVFITFNKKVYYKLSKEMELWEKQSLPQLG